MTNNEKYEINLNRTTCLLSGFQIANINQTLRLIKMKYNNSCTYREPFMYFCVTCSFGPSRRGWKDIQKAETILRNCWFLSPLVLSKWENLAFSVCSLFEVSVIIFQFLNYKMKNENYVKQNITVNFTIQNWKKTHFSKNYTNWES